MLQPNAPKQNPAPAPGSDEHFLLSFDGTAIHYWLWQAPAAKPGTPTVLIVHGAGEYAARYREFAAFLNSAGYSVAAFDLRGFGQSGGARAYVNSFSDYVLDLNAVAAQVLRLTGAPRIHLIGHSMGGLIASTAAAGDQPVSIASLTLSSPCFALSFPVPAHLRAIGAVCSSLHPKKLFPTKAISELLTHDPVIARLHREDPQIVHFMSARLFFQMHAAMKDPARLARRIQVPTGVFQAGDDRVVDQKASRAFFESLDCAGKRWTLYPNYFHEILNESDRAGVHRDILAFLQTNS